MARFFYPCGALKSVYLLNGFDRRSGAYGETVRYENIDGLSAAITEAVLLKPSRLSGDEIAYLRDLLDLFQEELADLLGVDEQTISLWERNKHNISKACDVLIRQWVLAQKRINISKSARKTPVEKLVRLTSSVAAFDFVFILIDGAWTAQYSEPQNVYVLADPAEYFTLVLPFHSAVDIADIKLEEKLHLDLKSEKVHSLFWAQRASHSIGRAADMDQYESTGTIRMASPEEVKATLKTSSSTVLKEVGIPEVDQLYSVLMTKNMEIQNGKNCK